MIELKPCPCGKVPENLCVTEGSTYRWLYVEGDCGCGWQTEVRASGYPAMVDNDYKAAVKGWNAMPRKELNNE